MTNDEEADEIVKRLKSSPDKAIRIAKIMEQLVKTITDERNAKLLETLHQMLNK